jgi:hypothetical protein
MTKNGQFSLYVNLGKFIVVLATADRQDLSLLFFDNSKRGSLAMSADTNTTIFCHFDCPACKYVCFLNLFVRYLWCYLRKLFSEQRMPSCNNSQP